MGLCCLPSLDSPCMRSTSLMMGHALPSTQAWHALASTCSAQSCTACYVLHCTHLCYDVCTCVLQVLLDMLGLDELSDFLKLMCSSISTASSRREGSNSMHAGAMRPSTSASVRSAAAASVTAASAVGAVSFKSAGNNTGLGHGMTSVHATAVVG